MNQGLKTHLALTLGLLLSSNTLEARTLVTNTVPTLVSASPPTITIQGFQNASSFASGNETDHQSVLVKFTLSEPAFSVSPHDFAQGDVTVMNGSLSNWNQVSTTEYTATLTATSQGDSTIFVSDGVFSNGDGLPNDPSNTFAWTHGTDPAAKSQVVSSIQASHESIQRLSSISIDHPELRMDWLRRHNGDSSGLTFSFSNPQLNQSLLNPVDYKSLDSSITDIEWIETSAQLNTLNVGHSGQRVLGDWYLWTAAQLTLSDMQNKGTVLNNESSSANLAVGMDKSTDDSIFGFTVVGMKDKTDIGSDGTQQNANGTSFSIYGGFNPESLPPVEFTLGVGEMSIDSTRMDTGQILTGTRRARTIFGSAGLVAEPIYRGKARMTPYSKIEMSRSILSGYSETGGTLALSYDKEAFTQTVLKIGSDVSYETTWMNGKLTPFTRVEWAYDISPGSTASMRYTSSGNSYRLTTDKQELAHLSVRVGSDYAHMSGLSTSIFYERTESLHLGHSDSVQLKLSIPF